MKKSNSILLISAIALILVIVIVAVAFRLEVKPSYTVHMSPTTGNTFVATRIISVNDAKNTEDATQSYAIKNFDRIETKGLFNLSVKQGKKYQVFITAPKNLFSFITVDKEGSTLSIAGIHQHKQSFTATVTLPRLKSVDLKGMGSTQIANFNERKLFIHAKGMMNLEGVNNQIASLVLYLKGAAHADFSTDKIQNAKVDLKGVAHANLHMTGGSLTGSVEGISGLVYSGNVKTITVSQRGVSSIEKD